VARVRVTTELPSGGTVTALLSPTAIRVTR
jgi:hypothetical protein